MPPRLEVMTCFDIGGCAGYPTRRVLRDREQRRAWRTRLRAACAGAAPEELTVERAFGAAGILVAAYTQAVGSGLTAIVEGALAEALVARAVAFQA